MSEQPTTSGLPSAPVRATIEVTPGVCGGKPRIAGTRIRVQDIYVWHELQGQTADQIVSQYPHLTMGSVYAALAYFWDHREEILRQMRAEEAYAEVARRKYGSPLRETQARRNGLKEGARWRT
jgi:uncharacterized protein (DUF433 family)